VGEEGEVACSQTGGADVRLTFKSKSGTCEVGGYEREVEGGHAAACRTEVPVGDCSAVDLVRTRTKLRICFELLSEGRQSWTSAFKFLLEAV